MQPISLPNDASDKIWLRLTHWSQRYSCLKVWTHRLTDGRTHGRKPARPVYYKLTQLKILCKQKFSAVLVSKIDLACCLFAASSQLDKFSTISLRISSVVFRHSFSSFCHSSTVFTHVNLIAQTLVIVTKFTTKRTQSCSDV